MRTVLSRLLQLLVVLLLLAPLGCDDKAKKSNDKPSDLAPPADPGSSLPDPKGKAPTVPQAKP